MKVLHISNNYFDGGGDCTYLFSLNKLLEKDNHKNIIFSMNHPQNLKTEYSKYFVSYINYVEELKKKNPFSVLKVLSHSIYSFEAKEKIEKLIEDEKPDIAHIQSLHHHLTHSILYPLKSHKIPIVWTLHDYALICPNTLFLCKGQVCESCKKSKFYWSVIKKCKKGSYGASLIAVIETLAHRIMNVYDMVDFFITPSEFLRNKLLEYGFGEEKIIPLNNFVDINLNRETGDAVDIGDYYTYVGRLSGEKGVKTLINAANKMNSGNLKIVGDGVLKDELVSYVNSKNKNDKIQFLGHKDHKEVIDLIRKCKFMIMPSECYENFPYAVLEAFACGRPVIGARIGGIPELVRDNETGLTFESGNSNDLVSKIKYMENNPDEVARMGKNAKLFVEQKLNKEKHYKKIMEIYRKAISITGSR